MAIDRMLIIIMALGILAIVLTIQAFGQFDSILKGVLRSPKDEPDPEPVSLRVIAHAAVAAAIAVLCLLIAFLT